jgi:hypothetical protein
MTRYSGLRPKQAIDLANHLISSNRETDGRNLLWLTLFQGEEQDLAIEHLTERQRASNIAADRLSLSRRILVAAPARGSIPLQTYLVFQRQSEEFDEVEKSARRLCILAPRNSVNWLLAGSNIGNLDHYRRSVLLAPEAAYTLHSCSLRLLRGTPLYKGSFANIQRMAQWLSIVRGTPHSTVAVLHYLAGNFEASQEEYDRLEKNGKFTIYDQSYRLLLNHVMPDDEHDDSESSAAGVAGYLDLDASKVTKKGYAMLSGVSYICRYLTGVTSFPHNTHVREYAASVAPNSGLICEFGVCRGSSINHLAGLLPDRKIHGFDSFVGLPEKFERYEAGKFSAGNKLPDVPANVTLHKGWFQATLPNFVETLDQPVALVHIDCDLYSSTKLVFDSLAPWISPGTIIVFDEYLGYDRWEEEEFRAFQEFVEENSVTYRYITYSRHLSTVAVKIEKIEKR